jgi:hypothetical protein
LALWVLVGMAATAFGQVKVFHGPGASLQYASRNLVFHEGRYYVFFSTGTAIAYSQSANGLDFSPPQVVTEGDAAAPNLGFSVAKHGAKLALVWGNEAGGTSSLWYREGTLAPGLSFTPAVKVDASVELRGYQPSVAFNAQGRPFIAAVEYGRGYAGPLTGCGPADRYRVTLYLHDGAAWSWRSYCNNFQTNRDPFSVAAVPAGSHMVAAAIFSQSSNLSTAIHDATTSLGEPWTLTTSATKTASGQLSAVQGHTPATDLHYLYQNESGGISYLRQDGTNTSTSANGLNLTVLAPAGRFPALSRPAAATGCYTALYFDGASIHQQRFSGSIASVSQASVLQEVSGLTWLTAESESASAPALSWQVGDSVYFGTTTGGAPAPTLSASALSAAASGLVTFTVSSSAFTDGCGAALAEGTLLTVGTSLGAVTEPDQDAALPGVQRASSGGRVTFTVEAPASVAQATVWALPASGGPTALTTVDLGAGTGGGGEDANPRILTVGSSCQSTGGGVSLTLVVLLTTLARSRGGSRVGLRSIAPGPSRRASPRRSRPS